jgi:sRNA-binding regulator protein Hfq
MANAGKPAGSQDHPRPAGPPPKPKPPADLAKRVLEENRRFEAVLEDGERWACKLVEWGQYDLLVETTEGLVLLPKHSIHHIVVERRAAESKAEA